MDQTKEQLLEELAALRKQVARLEPGSDRLREQQAVLLTLAASPTLQQADLEAALHEITEAAGRYLGVARASVWLYNEERSSIRCLDLFDQHEGKHQSGLELFARDFPGYFEALATERAIDAHDAHQDPRTCEFSSSYLQPLGIGAMLDAPIRGDGRMLGVVCNEHIGPARQWSSEELSFAGSIGDMVSLAIASHERRRLESRILQSQKLESLGVLAGGISHEFNNLLVGILANAEMARDGLPAHAPSRELLADIELAARQAADLCNQLVAYAGKSRFRIATIELDVVIEQMGELLETSVSKTVVLRPRVGGQRPLIEADVLQIRQVVMNIVMNAADALGEGSGVVEVVTGVVDCDRAYLDQAFLGEQRAEGRYAFVEISDMGCGMDPAMIGKIFDPFYTSKFAGRGLGLAAVLGVVRGHDGAIRIETELGRGTTFRILFPLSSASVEPVTKATKPVDWTCTGVVLLVDDDKIVRTVGQRIMQRAGLEVLTACDGVEGLELFREHSDEIACIVLDLTMPRMGGEQMFRELRLLDEDVPVVLCSGYGEQEVIGSFVDQNLAGFVEKPYDKATLLDAIRNAMVGSP